MTKLTKQEVREKMRFDRKTSFGDRWKIVRGSKIFVFHGAENKAVDFFYKKLK